MVFHVPSFLAGSVVSGAAFLAVHQQLSYRNRLTYKWPLAEWAEAQVRDQWKGMQDRIAQNPSSQIATRDIASASVYWNKGVASVKEYFDKKE